VSTPWTKVEILAVQADLEYPSEQALSRCSSRRGLAWPRAAMPCLSIASVLVAELRPATPQGRPWSACHHALLRNMATWAGRRWHRSPRAQPLTSARHRSPVLLPMQTRRHASTVPTPDYNICRYRASNLQLSFPASTSHTTPSLN